MSQKNTLVRIQKEYKEVHESPSTIAAGVSAELVNNSFAHWKGKIKGPAGTPYQDGTFIVDIVIPSNYPFEPPKCRFDTKVWHPNISSANGAICLDILKTEWSPALTLRTVLLSLQALLSCPNPDDPQDAQVATQLKNDRAAFETTAAYWTQAYAVQKEKNIDEAVKKLMEMGFDAGRCRAALEKCNYDEEQALNHLLSST